MNENQHEAPSSQEKVNKIEIPDKLYFKIGEVAKLIGVEPYVLRYWETEFPQISPSKSKSNQRLYKKQDVEMIVSIRNLLYDQKYTISGAKRKLREVQRIRRQSVKSTEQMPLNLEPDTHYLEIKEQLHKDLQSIIREMDEFLKD